MHPVTQATQPSPAPLPDGALLQARYAAGCVIAQTENEFVYDGYDRHDGRAVAVHEYLPADLLTRQSGQTTVSPISADCAGSFLTKANAFFAYASAMTEAVGTTGLMNVRDAFFENGTAYYITDAVPGVTLREFLAFRGGRLSDGETVTLLHALSGGLLVLHSLSLAHGAISLENIFLPEAFLPTPVAPMLSAFALPQGGMHDAQDAPDADAFRQDIRLLGRALCLARTGQTAPADFPERAATPLDEPLRTLFYRMVTPDARRGYASVFELLHALGGIDIPRVPLIVDRTIFAAYRRRVAEEAERRTRNVRRSRLLRRALIALAAILLLLCAALFYLLKN